ncbi:unnamed protein product [Durusdinium trenchii]|uniref:DUF4116 domain-containing protein n=1 Tax=Durusdinium trenchii TaxID=1381693 RepID=A0ABP0M6Q4_9DINO
MDQTDMQTVSGPFCALTFARPRLLASTEGVCEVMAEHWRMHSGHAVIASKSGLVASVYDGQVSQRLLVFFEELSQALGHRGVVVAVLPGFLELKEAVMEALALTAEARRKCRLICLDGPLFQEPEMDSPEQILQNFGPPRSYRLQILGARAPTLYMAQDTTSLGRPVLGVLATCERGEVDEPPPLAAGLKVTLQGLSGCLGTMAAGHNWTVGQLKDAYSSRRELRLLPMSAPVDLPDEQLLSELLNEPCATHLSLRLLRVSPEWADAVRQLRADPRLWRDLEEDLKADRDLTLMAVAQEPSLLRETAFLSDAQIVLAAAGKEPLALQAASSQLWHDDDFVCAAVALDASALQRAMAHRELGITLALRAVEQNGLALEFLPPELHLKEIVEAALAQDPCALQFAPEAMRDDPHLLQSLLRREGRALRFASKRLRGDRHLVLLAIASCPRAVLCASEDSWQGRLNVLLAAMERDPQLASQLAHYAARIP